MNKKTLLLSASLVIACGAGLFAAVNARQNVGRSPLETETQAMTKSDKLNENLSSSVVLPTKDLNIVVTLPVEMTPTADDVALFTIIDCNDTDGKTYKTWTYNSAFKALITPTSYKPNADDWAITPGIQFTSTEKNYELAFDAFQNMAGASFCSSIEFYIGTAPTVDAMTTKIGSIEKFYSEVAEKANNFKFQFAVPETGVYYIGFYCKTPYTYEDGADGWPMYFRNISVKEIDSSAAAPAQPEVTVTPADKGALTASVAFTMPTTAMNGTALTTDANLTAIIKSPAETKTVSAAPGAAVSETIATQQGSNEISVQINGEKEGEAQTFNIYTGVYRPMRINHLKGALTRDNLSMTLTWDKPTESEDNGYCDFDNLEYGIYTYNSTTLDYDLVADAGKNLTYTYTLEAGSQLRSVQLYVFPRNEAGVSQDRINWVFEEPLYVREMLGEPYKLPAIEAFDGQDLKYSPITVNRPEGYSGRWYVEDPSAMLADDNQSALICYNPLAEDATMGRITLPKFSTKGLQNAALTLTTLNYSGYSSEMRIYGRSFDTDTTLIGTITYNSGDTKWVDSSYPLPEVFQNCDWVQFIIECNLDDVDYMYAIDKYTIAQSAEHDVAVTVINGPTGVYTGEDNEYAVHIHNLGFSAVESLNVKYTLTVDGQEDAYNSYSAKIEQAIASNGEIDATYKFSPTVDMVGKDVRLTATITDTDEVADNNSLTIAIEVREPVLPTVNDLQATTSDKLVKLTWSEPAANKTVIQSFEDETAFSYGSNLAGFTNYDGDGKEVYKFASITMPNESTPKAFMVIDDRQLSSSEGLEAKSGNQYLMATCPAMTATIENPDPADDWLISPEVKGGTYVSFYVNIINEAYPETFQVAVSTTGNSPQDFNLNNPFTVTKQKLGWQFVELKLPENAKYFAIHYISQNQFGILIDDIRYVSATDNVKINGYKVYRDNDSLEDVTATAYNDQNVENGETHTYYVTALTADGESSRSNVKVVVVNVSSVADIQAIDDAKGNIYDTRGILIRQDASKEDLLSLPAGVYIFNGIKIIRK